MEIVTTYIADDGSAFADEESCLDYERAQKLKELKPDDYRFVTKKGADISLLQAIERFETVQFIFVKTQEAAKIINEAMKNEWEMPWDQLRTSPKPGAWADFELTGDWVDLTEYLEKVMEIKPDWFTF